MQTLSSDQAASMKSIHITARAEWRRWLAENHDKEPNGIWLIFGKKKTGSPSLDYEDAVEEALCFGWIDSIIRRIDEETYCRKFTPRKDNSVWSKTNRERVAKMINEGRMTEFGLTKIKAAKRLGNWGVNSGPSINFDMPRELAHALAGNAKAEAFFNKLAPTYRKHFIGWIVIAKRPETRAKRLAESLALLERGEKLGLK